MADKQSKIILYLSLNENKEYNKIKITTNVVLKVFLKVFLSIFLISFSKFKLTKNNIYINKFFYYQSIKVLYSIKRRIKNQPLVLF